MKRIITFFTALMFAAVSWGQVDTVNIGSAANDGTGESLRSAFLKVNDFMDVFNGAYLYHLTLAGDDALTLTTSGATNVTLPTSGTLATTANVAAKVNIADTAAMLDKYARKHSPTFTGVATLPATIGFSSAPTILFSFGGAIEELPDGLIITDGTLTIDNGIDIGGTDDYIDSASFVGTKLALYTNGTDTTATYIPVADRDDAATIFPTIQSAAGDTSNYDTPDKIGDLYIDTSAGKVYVSVAAARGGWRILNYFLPLFMFWNLKRRRRK